MKTPLIIDDGVFRKLKREAAAQGRTLSELVDAALRQFLARRPSAPALPPLPTAALGLPLVDVADRGALYRAMEGR